MKSAEKRRCNNGFPSFSLDLIQRWWIKHGDGCRPLTELGNTSGVYRPYAPESVCMCVYFYSDREGMQWWLTLFHFVFTPLDTTKNAAWKKYLFRHLHIANLFLVKSDSFWCFLRVPLYPPCVWCHFKNSDCYNNESSRDNYGGLQLHL